MKHSLVTALNDYREAQVDRDYSVDDAEARMEITANDLADTVSEFLDLLGIAHSD